MRRSPGLNGIIRPKRQILGMELAGEIETVGTQVTRFKRGDKVFGNTGMKLGAYAECVCLPEDGALAIKPSTMTFEEAAAITNGSLTALPFLREKGFIEEGQTILINGASGSVGTAAVQIAKAFGALVTGVCSTPKIDLVKSLGANSVIDYTKEDFTADGRMYDIVFDVAGKSSFSRCRNILKSGGKYLATVPTPAILFHMAVTSRFMDKKVRFGAMGLRPARKKAKDLDFLREFIESGKLSSVIDRTYPLEQIADAHRYVEKGNKTGSVVITVKNAAM
jgi:NADPH:quinone reductase-like Zn-dependent oxidoreductase